MDKFISNVKKFMSLNGIKTNYLITRTDVNASKIYNVFGKNTRGTLLYHEMVTISKALGHNIEYFENGEFDEAEEFSMGGNLQFSFYSSKVTEKDKKTMEKVKNLVLRYNAIVG